MSSRMRSPKYPSIPLGQAIDYISQIHEIERTNPIDREVAAKALGYTGISGRSATVLASLVQYGLLQRTGKNEIRVTKRAVEILYPDSQQLKDDALRDAAQEPELFQRVIDRFTDGEPSENALRSFLVKEGYTNAAISPAIAAFQETFAFLENEIDGGSYWNDAGYDVENQLNQIVEGDIPIGVSPHAKVTTSGPFFAGGKPVPSDAQSGPEIHFIQKKIWLGGVIASRSEAQEMIDTISALMPMLQDRTSEVDEAEEVELMVLPKPLDDF